METGTSSSVSDVSISTDGQWLGFISDGSYKKVSLDNGAVVTLAEPSRGGAHRGAAWTLDGRVVLGNLAGLGLRAFDASGRPDVTQLTTPGPNELHRLPAALPGGRALLFTNSSGLVTDWQVAVLDLSSGSVKNLFPGTAPAYVPTGHIVYTVEGALRAVAFDARTLEVRGNPATVATGVATSAQGSGNFAVSDTGTLVYVAGLAGGGVRRLVWADRSGKEDPISAPERAYAYARLSPDGTRIALDVRDQQNDIWVWDVARETLTRLTFDPGLNRLPVWTPDGRRLAFTVADRDQESAFWMAADGSGMPEELQKGEGGIAAPMAFTPDGAWFLFSWPSGQPFNISRAPVGGDRKAERVLATEFNEFNPEVSPDGRWMAYQSGESGREEIYVRPWPDVNAGRWQVSTGGGTRPLWSRDGRELFYYWQGGVMAVPVRAGTVFSVGTPVQLFRGDYFAGLQGRQYRRDPRRRAFPADQGRCGRRFAGAQPDRGSAKLVRGAEAPGAGGLTAEDERRAAHTQA